MATEKLKMEKVIEKVATVPKVGERAIITIQGHDYKTSEITSVVIETRNSKYVLR